MRRVFTANGWEDYLYWQRADHAVLKRRITEEHRLVHLVEGEDLVVLQARYHYR